MDVFSAITLIGGLAFFLYGMQVLSSGLERMAGGKMEALLKTMTGSRVKALLLGMGVTAAIQSSSAVTVMLVGLVNSGILTIGRSIGVIMGSNIGTTMTAWVLTLVGIESDNAWIRLLKPENFSLIFAFVGVLLMAGSKRKKDVGSSLIGFAVLMYGMELMSAAVEPLSHSPAFMNLFTAFKNPILGVFAGFLITAVIQSSSASVGILQALALTGGVSYGAAIPIIMGQNIGTCVTALISGFGVGRNAKKVAVVHITFNLIGTAVCLLLYSVGNALFRFPFADQPIDAVGIAVVHTAFNLFTTAMLLPFSGALEKFADFVLPSGKQGGKSGGELLDKRLLATPSVAVSECDSLVSKMSQLANETLHGAIGAIDRYDRTQAEQIRENETMLDHYEDALGTYLVLLSSKRLSEADAQRVSKMLHVIGDFERLGDHALNLLSAAKELHGKNLRFSAAAKQELNVLTAAVGEILSMTEAAYQANDSTAAMRVEPLEQTVDRLVAEIKSRHIQRLQAGECSIELGFILSDILNNLERISDHCSNIAVAVIELSHNSFDTHRYLSEIRSDNEEYREAYRAFGQKYELPRHST